MVPGDGPRRRLEGRRGSRWRKSSGRWRRRGGRIRFRGLRFSEVVACFGQSPEASSWPRLDPPRNLGRNEPPLPRPPPPSSIIRHRHHFCVALPATSAEASVTRTCPGSAPGRPASCPGRPSRLQMFSQARSIQKGQLCGIANNVLVQSRRIQPGI